MNQFIGKSVLITGASQGIGKACAIKFAKEGATVFVNYSSNETAASETLSLIQANGGKGRLLKSDLGEENDIRKMWAEIQKEVKVPDVLVLNAAYQKKVTALDTDIDLLKKTFAVNVFGNFLLAKLYIEACLKEKKEGNIVVHSSNQGEFVNPTGFAYSLSKAALNQMVKHLALACVADKIRINGVVLGWFDTDGERKFYSKEQIAEQSSHSIPIGRAGSPEEAANMTYFLATESSSYMTGSLVRYDGGFALAPIYLLRNMAKLSIIFGAGKTGRGFAAHLCANSGFNFVLVDKDQQKIDLLKKAGKFDIEVLGNPSKNAKLTPLASFHIADRQWISDFVKADVCFTAVFGNNFNELAIDLAQGLTARFAENRNSFFNIITCENLSHAAAVLKTSVLKNITDEKIKLWLDEKVGFVESMILKTCLDPSLEQDALTVRAQNLFDLPCDQDAFKGAVPEIKGLSPVRQFENQLLRKIYTYNCINAVITYLGAAKGYTELYQAGNDPEIDAAARLAGKETSEALIKEFGFDRDEQNSWLESAFQKFSDKNIPDPISRNGADPVRKLAAEDRLIGPANLALKHGIYPEGILKGILAGFAFTEKGLSINSLIKEKGLKETLQTVCGLEPTDKLFGIISNTVNEKIAE